MAEEEIVAGDAPAGRGEHRWPMALAALAAGVLHQLLPSDFSLGSPVVVPVADGRCSSCC